MSRAAKMARLALLLVAAAHVGALAWVFVRRDAYPFDLEWMEGGSLCHALRLVEHRPIYAPPSVDFVPFLYTPLYPALLALLAQVLGLGYAMARAVSVASFVGATVLAYRLAAREGGSRASAAAAMAIPAACFALTGAWYDLARADSLALFLSTAGLVLLYRAARPAADPAGPDAAKSHERPREPARARQHLLAALAGAVLVAAFFTKQTAVYFMVAGGLALVVLDLRLVPAFAGALALFGLPSLWMLNRATGGWFWRYVFELHQGHDFYARRAFIETPGVLLGLLGPALLIPAWALVRRPTAALGYALWIGLAGFAVACTGFGTQWAFTNAYIPGVFFPSLAIGLGAGQLVGTRREPAPRLRPVVVFLILGASLLARRVDGRWQWNWDPPARFIPTAADRVAGERLIARLRAVDGEVMIPFHPFYAHLAGKSTFVHQMGVMDVGRAGLGVPAGLAEALRAQRFALVVVDDKIFDKWAWWPGLRERYRDAEPIVGPHVVSGAMTVPNLILVPRKPEPPPPPAEPPATPPAEPPATPIDLELQ